MRKSRKSKQKKRIESKYILFSFVLFLLIGYLIYSSVLFFSIKTADPLFQNLSTSKILSQTEDNFEKTAFILEKDTGNERKISEVYVFLTNSSKENSLLIYIPGSVYFSGLEESFGSPISISSLCYAGEFLQEGRGVEYTLWQLNEILGFKVDDYVWIRTEALDILNDVYGDVNEVKEKYKEEYLGESDSTFSDSLFKLHTISSNYSSIKTVLSIRKVQKLDENIYSNLSFSGVLRKISTFGSIVEETETRAIDIGSTKYSVQELSDQGGQIKSINTTELDGSLQDYLVDMIDRNLEKERVRIEVYNASGVAGKAAIYARKIQNNGCDVVRYGNAPSEIEKTEVYISNESEFGNSLSVVSEVLLGRFEKINERPSFMTTGDIVILLGEDISQIEIF